MRHLHLSALSAIFSATALVVACGTDLPMVPIDTDDAGGRVDAGDAALPAVDAAPAATYSVGVSVTGLSGTGLVLQNSGGDDLPIASNGTFYFSTKLAAGAPYAVTVKTNPSAPSQACTVSAGSGTVGNGNVTSITVNCDTTKFTVGGSVTGLTGSGLVLQNNGGDDLVVSDDGTFAFPTAIASGASYAVSVKTQPGTPSQTCTVTEGAGTIVGAAVTNVAIACTTNKYAVGGKVTGLTGNGLVLQLDGGETLPIPQDGDFTFVGLVDSGKPFAVIASAQPSGPTQTCTVSGGTGTVGGAAVTSIAVNCATNAFTISGSATGLLGTAVLTNNGGNDLNVTANGTFAFTVPVPSGQSYAVAVKTQPGSPSQTCTLSNESGNVVSADISNVALACVTDTFKVKASITGLSGTGLILENNAGDDLPVGVDGTVEFTSRVASGQTFDVKVKTQPTGPSQICTVTGGTGKMDAADVTASIVCETSSFTIGGTVSGLSGSGLELENGGEIIPVNAAGGFTFPTKVLSGMGYAVSVKTQPNGPSQTCTVSSPSGTVTNGNVVTVLVNCATDTFAVGGSVNGLVGTGLVLQNNAGSDLTINGNGDFSFPTPVASGTGYAVTVKTQPTNPWQTCTVSNASGAVTNAAITTVSVSCTTKTFSVGGTVTGLAGSPVVLQLNGGGDVSVGADGSFAFPTVLSGTAYAVTVKKHPTARSCSVANASGSVGNANIANVTVTCAPWAYATGRLPTGNTNLALVFVPQGTDFPSVQSYYAWCTDHGFAPNSFPDANRASQGFNVNDTSYYCRSYCCFLNPGMNGMFGQLSGFTNVGLPLNTPMSSLDHACGTAFGPYPSGSNLSSTLTVTGPTTATYTGPADVPSSTPKSTTFARDGVITCQMP